MAGHGGGHGGGHGHHGGGGRRGRGRTWGGGYGPDVIYVDYIEQCPVGYAAVVDPSNPGQIVCSRVTEVSGVDGGSPSGVGRYYSDSAGLAYGPSYGTGDVSPVPDFGLSVPEAVALGVGIGLLLRPLLFGKR